MITPLELAVYALTTWRLSSLFVYERGPFDLFERLREAVGIQHNEDGLISVVPETALAGLFSCVWCISAWFGGIIALLAYFAAGWTFWLALPLALSGAAVIIESFVRR